MKTKRADEILSCVIQTGELPRDITLNERHCLPKRIIRAITEHPKFKNGYYRGIDW